MAIATPASAEQLNVNETGWWIEVGSFNYSSVPIQSAINNATAGDSIIVNSGTYNENVNVNKKLTLRGNDTGTGLPVVNAFNTDLPVFELTSQDGIILDGFIAANSSNDAGFHIDSSNNTLTNNIAYSNKMGIELHFWDLNNTIYKNIMYQNEINAVNDNNTNSRWNNSAFGNYYDDIISIDNDNNGINDIPYSIDNNSTDYFPLVVASRANSPAIVNGNSPFTITTNLIDHASVGIQNVSLYYNMSDSGGIYSFYGNSSTGAFTFTPPSVGDYYFYTVAIDNHVVVEGIPDVYDSHTTVFDNNMSSISFEPPTPSNGEEINQRYVYINTTVYNASTAFIEWNRSLAGWWRFNAESGENSKFFWDWSSWGKNGICSGTSCPTSSISGKFGNALSFDGSNDYVSTSSIGSGASGTMEAWIKPNVYTGTQFVMGGLNSGGADIYARYSVFVRNTNVDVCPSGDWGTIIANGTSAQYACSGQIFDQANFSTGIWKHIAITYDGSSVKFYNNGTLINTVAQNVSGAGNAQPFSIGRGGAYNGLYFNGSIDEVRIHSRALSPEEISASYSAETNRLYGNFTNLADGVYNFDAYAQNVSGIVAQTETRTLNVTGTAGPAITSFAPSSTVTDIPGDARTFNITTNEIANVDWYINGTQVKPTEIGITEAKYINNSAALGIWNVSAVASNANGSTMKTWIWIVSFAPSISFTDPTPVDATILTQNFAFINTTISGASTAFIDWNRSLAGWWRFNSESGENLELFRDWSSWRNNGTCSGTSCPTSSISGKFGNALSFDGSNDYLNAGNIASGASGTMEAWIKPNVYTGTQFVMGGLNSSGADNKSQYSIFVRNTDVLACPSGDWGTIIANGTSAQFACSGQIFNSNNFPSEIWKHIAITYDGSSVKFYYDGALIKTVDQTISGAGNAQPFSIGRGGAYDKGLYFNGKIDEVRIHSRALSPEEISASYSAGTNILYGNFTSLANGDYHYTAHAQNLPGIVGKTETRTLTVVVSSSGAPVITRHAPESPVNDDVGATREFNITLNYAANVTWYINGIQVEPTENDVTSASYTNTSASQGNWIVNATATNANGTVSIEWNWNVAPQLNITITSPANNSENRTGDVRVMVNLNREGTALLNWNGVNESMDKDGTSFSMNKTGLLSGIYRFRIFANDSDGINNVSETMTITVNRSISITLENINTSTFITNGTTNINSPGGNVTVTVPNGTNASLNGSYLPSISIDSFAEVDSKFIVNLSSGDKLIGENLSLGPAGAVFSPDIQIRFNYTDQQIAGLNEADLSVKYYNNTMNNWEALPIFERNISGNYLIVNASHFSMFALIGKATVPTPTPTPCTNCGSSGGSGGSSGGGGGGGGGSSGENFTNIVIKEKYYLFIYKDKVTSYRFSYVFNPISFVNITGNVNAGEISTAVEVLKNTSSLLKTTAPGMVYKNMNIWVGTSGFATTKNIKESVIRFKVENTWIKGKDLDDVDIKLVKWDGAKWIPLETKVMEKDGTNTYFEANTNGFSNFAITGLKETKAEMPTITNDSVPTQSVSGTPGVPILPQENASPVNLFIILGVFLGIVVVAYLGKGIFKK